MKIKEHFSGIFFFSQGFPPTWKGSLLSIKYFMNFFIEQQYMDIFNMTEPLCVTD